MFPGRVVADQFRVLRVLGRGGMGVVSEAERLDTGERFALKFLREDVESELQPSERFFREASLATKLKSPHACRIFGVSEWELGPFIIMELLDGRPLNAAMDPGTPMHFAKASRIIFEACQALTEAHLLGIVHRDIKPGNIFLAWTKERDVITKVLDFGVAKIPAGVVTLGGAPSLTDASLLLGTPAYVAPEQLSNSKLVDARADIWALGVMLYEMLSGRLPFQSPFVPKLLLMIAREDPPPLAELAPSLPQPLVQIVERCLSKDPALRFDSAASLGEALHSYALAQDNDLTPLLLMASLRPIRLTSSVPAPMDLHEESEPTDSALIRLQPDSLGPHTTARLEPRPSGWRPTYSRAVVAAGLIVLAAAIAFVAFPLRMQTEAHRDLARASVPARALPSVRRLPISVTPRCISPEIFLDGKSLGHASSIELNSGDGAEHTLRVEAAGFETRETVFRNLEATSLSVALTPMSGQPEAADSEPAEATKPKAARQENRSASAPTIVRQPTKASGSRVAAPGPDESPKRSVPRKLDAANPF